MTESLVPVPCGNGVHHIVVSHRPRARTAARFRCYDHGTGVTDIEAIAEAFGSPPVHPLSCRQVAADATEAQRHTTVFCPRLTVVFAALLHTAPKYRDFRKSAETSAKHIAGQVDRWSAKYHVTEPRDVYRWYGVLGATDREVDLRRWFEQGVRDPLEAAAWMRVARVRHAGEVAFWKAAGFDTPEAAAPVAASGVDPLWVAMGVAAGVDTDAITTWGYAGVLDQLVAHELIDSTGAYQWQQLVKDDNP